MTPTPRRWARNGSAPGRDVNDLILLTLGTGIGSGIIVEGKILRGYLGMAAEIGHTTYSPNGYPCGCGNTGCVEKYASATAVSSMARLLNLGPNLSSEEVFHLAKGGNTRALQIFDSVGLALGTLTGDVDQHFQFPALSAGRRHDRCLGVVRSVHAG